MICGHGPSLNEDKEKIERLQKDGDIIRFSVNNWYHYFKIAPDYWVISNSQFSFPIMHEIMNKYKSPVLYSTDGDFSSDEYIQNLSCSVIIYHMIKDISKATIVLKYLSLLKTIK